MWIQSSHVLASGGPAPLSEEERLSLEGTDGLFHTLCPVWKTHKYKIRFKHDDCEYLYSCSCKCRGCSYSLHIFRFRGGVLATQKCDVVGGNKFPIKHNTEAHKSFNANGNKGGSCSLSHAQKEYVVQHYKQAGNNSLFLKDLLAQNGIPSTEAQRKDSVALKKSFLQQQSKIFHWY